MAITQEERARFEKFWDGVYQGNILDTLIYLGFTEAIVKSALQKMVTERITSLNNSKVQIQSEIDDLSTE